MHFICISIQICFVNLFLDVFRSVPELAHKVSMYHGLLIDNFTCDSKLFRAVEVTAGSRLFNHIITNKEFAKDLLKEMNRQRLPGEVTFLPLDTLRSVAESFAETDDATPLLDKLVYQAKNTVAMKYE